MNLATVKIVFVGSSGVGKTSIIQNHRFDNLQRNGSLRQYSPTICASPINFDVPVRNYTIRLQIWDTAGQERYRSMVPLYMRNAYGAVLVYDITNRDSFDDIDEWADDVCVCQHIDPVLVLIGNKADRKRRRKVAEGEGITKAMMMDAKFYEMSAYDTAMIRELFRAMAEEIAERLDYVEDGIEVNEKIRLDTLQFPPSRHKIRILSDREIMIGPDGLPQFPEERKETKCCMTV